MAKVKLLDPGDSKRRLDRYELIGELASGGMASVFLARLAGVGGFQRFVAIKRLHPHLAEEQEFIEMFLDEARLAAGIHHPHVVPILEVGESERGYYLVMEYIEGDTLARIVARSLSMAKPVPRPILIRIVLDSLAGLHAAHDLTDSHGQPVNLVHRDVSPQNILVGVDGCTRITDFGVARASSRLTNTRADRLKGKLAYMAPEQARALPVDRRADVFAMGIILWEVLAGKRLFKAETEVVTLQRVTSEPIPQLSSVTGGIHAALDEVCRRALDRDVDTRFPTAADMADALERAARSASSSSSDLGVASPREVAAYVQGILGQDIAAQRESVRAWLSHSEPSLPRLSGVRPSVTSLGGRGPESMTSQVIPAMTPVPMSGAMASMYTPPRGHAPEVSQSQSFPYGAAQTPSPIREREPSSEEIDPDLASQELVDDTDEHETLLMERDAAKELARHKLQPVKPPEPEPPAPPPVEDRAPGQKAAFRATARATPARGVEPRAPEPRRAAPAHEEAPPPSVGPTPSAARPAAAPSRTPLLVAATAILVAAVIAVVLWRNAPPSQTVSTSNPPPPSGAKLPPPVPVATSTTTTVAKDPGPPASALKPSDLPSVPVTATTTSTGEKPALFGRVPHPDKPEKGGAAPEKTGAAPVPPPDKPTAVAPPPDLPAVPKPSDDEPNPYRNP